MQNPVKSCVVAGLFVACAIAVGWARQTTSSISGKLLGHDGKPMRKATVLLYRAADRKPVATAEVGTDGSYSLTATETGLFRLRFAGVDRVSKEIPLWLNTATTVACTVKLGSYTLAASLDNARITVQSPGTGKPLTKPVKLEKQADGTFVAEVSDLKVDRIAYQLVGVEADGRTINGTQSDDFEYDGGGDYRSIVAVTDGKVRIVFDPAKLPAGKTGSTVELAAPDSRISRIVGIFEQGEACDKKYNSAVRAHYEAKKSFDGFVPPDQSAAFEELVKKAGDEKDPLVRQAYLAICLGSAFEKNHTEKLARQALTEIPPTSPLWSLHPSSLSSAIEKLAPDNGPVPPEFDAYLGELTEKHPDSEIRSRITFELLARADKRGDDAGVRRYYDRIQKDFPNTQPAFMAKMLFNPDRKIKKGNALPAFSIAALGDAKTTYANDTFKGKIYLIDFWAVWCGPCVAEMGNLHAAYEKFKGKNFEILSLSFDAKPEDVAAFRKDKWKMPWLHAFVEGGFRSKLAEQFEVQGIPKPILVDQDGKILAAQGELRGEELDKTLTKHLGGNK